MSITESVSKGWRVIFGGKTSETAKYEDAIPDLASLSDPQAQQALTAVMIHDLLRERRSDRRWKITKRTFFSLLALSGLTYYAFIYASVSGVSVNKSHGDFVGVVRVQGEIAQSSLASADKIIPALKKAFEDPSVKTVVLAIDSPGGSPLEAERINFMIESLQKEHKKPIYASIQAMGASAAYLVAMHTDRIYAGRFSLVGSIGAVMSSWDVHKAINKYDVFQEVYASGQLKAMLNPFTEPTEAARVKAQELVNKAGQMFVKDLKARRSAVLKADVKYDTGEIWDGDLALSIGLIDELGTIEKIAMDRKLEIKEFGPGKQTFTPFSLGVSENLSAWTHSVIKSSISQALQENIQLQLK